MKNFSIRGKTVTVHNDGYIFVNGNATNIKQWQSSSKRYSDTRSGSEIKEISGLDLESALLLKGFV
jgi:hypothetical protein